MLSTVISLDIDSLVVGTFYLCNVYVLQCWGWLLCFVCHSLKIDCLTPEQLDGCLEKLTGKCQFSFFERLTENDSNC